MKLILASKSPRRSELMNLITSDFEIITREVDERLIEENYKGKDVMGLSEELAIHKAAAVYESLEESLKNEAVVIGADTTVICEGEVMGKPADKEDARRMLTKLSGKAHQVVTGVALISKNKKTSFSEVSDVIFNDLDEYQKSLIESYISSNDPYDKAGAYGIQNGGALLVKGISGDFFSVVGLPVQALNRALTDF